MDRCYKVIVSLLVVIGICTPFNKSLAEGNNSEKQSVKYPSSPLLQSGIVPVKALSGIEDPLRLPAKFP